MKSALVCHRSMASDRYFHCRLQTLSRDLVPKIIGSSTQSISAIRCFTVNFSQTSRCKKCSTSQQKYKTTKPLRFQLAWPPRTDTIFRSRSKDLCCGGKSKCYGKCECKAHPMIKDVPLTKLCLANREMRGRHELSKPASRNKLRRERESCYSMARNAHNQWPRCSKRYTP